MITFDEIIPKLSSILDQHAKIVQSFLPILINRDLNGRIRLILNEKHEGEKDELIPLLQTIHNELIPHAYPPEKALLFEPYFEALIQREITFPLEGHPGVHVVDRLATEGNWASIRPVSSQSQRIVFFSIKGGVGRSTALAATAWALAESGKRVLVMDLDLESPGLSSSLLPKDRRPYRGIVDWLVEDLVDNGDVVFNDLIATSSLSHNGQIWVVPAHGTQAGEYIPKLGRVWMPKMPKDGPRESWSQRLCRLINQLEVQLKPDVILLDSRAGIDEVASTCLTDLGASLILLFALDGDQTWSGYRILFNHWLQNNVARDIRERLQWVGAMIPVKGRSEYFNSLKEHAWDLFSEHLYDQIPAGELATEEGYFSFDENDDEAPHYPLAIKWHESFEALYSLHERLKTVEPSELQIIFGPLIEAVVAHLTFSEVRHE